MHYHYCMDFIVPKHICSRSQAKENGYRFFWGSICKNNHSGYRYVGGHCVECSRIKASSKEKLQYKKEYREKNKNKIREYNVKYYHSDREAQIKRSVDYLKKHPEIKRKHRQKYSEKIKQAIALWKEKNKDKCLTHSRNRRAKKENAGTHSTYETNKLLELQKNKCVYCSADLTKVKKHLDHIVPLHLGGSNKIFNLQWTCQKCNLSKHAKDPIDWAQQNGRLL